MMEGDWSDLAACKESEDLMFPKAHGPQLRMAQRICIGMECPVLKECREEGMGEEWGVWGGMTERERRDAREKRGMSRSITRKSYKFL